MLVSFTQYESNFQQLLVDSNAYPVSLSQAREDHVAQLLLGSKLLEDRLLQQIGQYLCRGNAHKREIISLADSR